MRAPEPDGEWLDAYVAANIAQDPATPVADIVHAVTSARPRLRDLSRTLAKTVFYALWVGPESLSTWFKRTPIAPAPRLVRPARKGDA